MAVPIMPLMIVTTFQIKINMVLFFNVLFVKKENVHLACNRVATFLNDILFSTFKKNFIRPTWEIHCSNFVYPKL